LKKKVEKNGAKFDVIQSVTIKANFKFNLHCPGVAFRTSIKIRNKHILFDRETLNAHNIINLFIYKLHLLIKQFIFKRITLKRATNEHFDLLIF